MSGLNVQVGDEVISAYSDLKLKRAYRYIICKIQHDKVVVDSTESRDATYENMLNRLSPTNPAYVIIDIESKDSQGNSRQHTVLLGWIPDAINIKERKLYSSSINSIKITLDSTIISYTASDFEELSLESVSKYVSENLR